MATAIDPTHPFQYILEEDRLLPLEEQTVWYLKYLTSRERSVLEDGLINVELKTQTSAMKMGSQSNAILKMGLVGVSNFKDAKGNPIEFPKGNSEKVYGLKLDDCPTDEFLSRIRAEWRRELANAIDAESEVKPEDLGKSVSPSSPSADASSRTADSASLDF